MLHLVRYSIVLNGCEYMKVMYSQPFIHHFMGLFGTNTVTISQLACLLLGRALHQYCIVVTLLHALIFFSV